MFELFLPYFIGLAIGIEAPGNGSTTQAATGTAAEAAAMATVEGSGDSDARTPEPQTPTGKFTTATEVKPILGVTTGNWAAVRLYDGQDLLYFTHLLAWRCGLWDIRYGLNGAPATEVFPMEPCHEDTATPNAMTDVINFLPYLAFPPESITSVAVEIVYDDGTAAAMAFERAEILIP